MTSFPYGTPDAFDAAVKAKLARAALTSPHGINELRRQFAYDRFLTRVFLGDPEGWVLKGGVGMLARLPTRARHSMDIDLYYQGSITDATQELRGASDSDLGDFFRFRLGPTRPLTGLHPGMTLAVTAYLGLKQFIGFQVDVVVAINMTGRPQHIQPLSPITVDGLITTRYPSYPIVDHIADKHAAMIATYADGAPSSRYRDLVDLVLLATSHHIEASDLNRALNSEYLHRQLVAPTTVSLPSAAWVEGYRKIAEQVPGLAEHDSDSALIVVRALLEPILNGLTVGVWNPNSKAWDRVEHADR